MRNITHSPAPITIVPSPPGRWNALPSARAQSSAITPTTTTKIAASTNE